MTRQSLSRELPIKLPPPIAESSNWQLRARCRDCDPTMFFDTTESESAEIAYAKAVCAGCPVREQCLGHAIHTGEQFGIWGGLTERERRQYKWFSYTLPPQPVSG